MEKLIELAISKNIKTLAITDHDSINGVKTIQDNNRIEVIKGIELSSRAPKGQFHILGYDLDLDSPILNNKIGQLRDISINSVLSLLYVN